MKPLSECEKGYRRWISPKQTMSKKYAYVVLIGVRGIPQQRAVIAVCSNRKKAMALVPKYETPGQHGTPNGHMRYNGIHPESKRPHFTDVERWNLT